MVRGGQECLPAARQAGGSALKANMRIAGSARGRVDGGCQLLESRVMAHALTDRYEGVIDRLIQTGRFANRSEVVRAGLRRLEEEYLRDYLHPPPLKEAELKRFYRSQSRREQAEELAATRASVQPEEGA